MARKRNGRVFRGRDADFYGENTEFVLVEKLCDAFGTVLKYDQRRVNYGEGDAQMGRSHVRSQNRSQIRVSHKRTPIPQTKAERRRMKRK